MQKITIKQTKINCFICFFVNNILISIIREKNLNIYSFKVKYIKKHKEEVKKKHKKTKKFLILSPKFLLIIFNALYHYNIAKY